MEFIKKTDSNFLEKPECDFNKNTVNKNSRDIPAINTKSTTIVQFSTPQNSALFGKMQCG